MANNSPTSESPTVEEPRVKSEPPRGDSNMPQDGSASESPVPAAQTEPPRIGLTLSGGGFRATLFHLGVIRYLRKEDLLRCVKVICSVSGGSVLAAHLVLYWDKWTGPDQEYLAMEEEIRNFATFGLRERIVRRWPFLILFDRLCMLLGIAIGILSIASVLGLLFGATWGFIGALLGAISGGGVGELIGRALRSRGFRYTETELLVREYNDNQLYKDKRLKHLSAQVDKGAPHLYMMATNLTRHDGPCYFSEKGFFVDSTCNGYKPVRAESSETSVARAVAASSAYPGLFRPLEVTSEIFGLPNSALIPSVQQLTDGGIYDNLGLEKGRMLKSSEGLKYLVVSDAGAAVDWEPEIRYSWSYTSTLLRVADIWQYRVNPHPNLLPDEVLISIHESSITHAGSPSQDAQSLIGRIRTDFNQFSLFEYRILRNHGFLVARACLDSIVKACRSARTAPVPPDPFEPELPDVPSSQFGSTLRKSAERPKAKGFLDCKDWVTWAYPLSAAIAILIMSFGLPYLAEKVEKLNKAMAETRRTRYPHSTLVLDPAKTVIDPVGLVESGTDIACDSIKRIIASRKSTLNDGECLIFVKQKEPFNGPFRTFLGQIRFDSKPEPKARAGHAFLVDKRKEAPGSGYREMDMLVDPSGYLTFPARVVVDSPEEYEYLVLLLVVKPAKSEERFPTGPTLDRREWNINLEAVR